MSTQIKPLKINKTQIRYFERLDKKTAGFFALAQSFARRRKRAFDLAFSDATDVSIVEYRRTKKGRTQQNVFNIVDAEGVSLQAKRLITNPAKLVVFPLKVGSFNKKPSFTPLSRYLKNPIKHDNS